MTVSAPPPFDLKAAIGVALAHGLVFGGLMGWWTTLMVRGWGG